MKDRIKQKAHDLFMQYGVRSITMDEIALQLGVSKKTLYQFYADKDEIVDAVLIDKITYNQECCSGHRVHAKDAVHEIFLAMDFVKEMLQNMNPVVLYDLEKFHPKSFQKFWQHKNEFMYTIIKNNIDWGIQEGLYRAEINADILSKIRIETMFLPFNVMVFPKTKYNLVDIEQELIEHFLFGLASPQGYKLIVKYKQERNKTTNSDEKIMAK